ncbi:MAG: HIT domain-containing protein [Candidatus Paceibacterota bacterium]|jgi:histidine triad (HIT) family protein
MTTPKSILFVCTGNIFRSLSAQECFKKYLADNGITDWTVGSAGTVADKAELDPKTLETLRSFGIENVVHEQRRLSREILDAYDVVVAMAEDHLEFMKSEFDYRYAVLFNEMAAHGRTSVRSVADITGDWQDNRPAVEDAIGRTVKHIHEKTPALFQNVSERFYLFSDFVEGRVTHRNGYPLITLHETPHSIAFMSVDIPQNEDGHVLVIPKTRYPNLSLIPDETLKDIFASIKKIGDAINTTHGGYNILLNNGLDAGQYMIHTHFHIIPRREGDGIKMEGWKHPKISREDFIELNEKLKQEIERVAS